MSEKEKKMLETIINGFSKMSDFEKGYVLGIVESKSCRKETSSDGGR